MLVEIYIFWPRPPTPLDLVSQSCRTGRNTNQVTAWQGSTNIIDGKGFVCETQSVLVTFIPTAWLDQHWRFVVEDFCIVHPASYPT